jgi:hypothetical protein
MIIIGDTDPENYDAGPPAQGILRFKQALNLLDSNVVDWNNDESYTTDTFHAYLAYDPGAGTPATTINPFVDGRIIDTLTSTELANVLAATDVPSTTTEILSWPDNSFVNLFDSTRHSDILDPFNALPATLGKAISTTYTKEVAMRLVCGVTSGTVLAASDKELTVRCQSGGTNETSGTFTPVVDYSFTGSTDGWTWTTISGFTAPVQTTSGAGTTGIGFIQATAIPTITGNCYYAGWLSPFSIPCTSAEGGKVYRASVSLESTSTSANTALGYRLRYYNKGYAHQGFVRYQTASTPLSGDVTNVPYAGNPLTVKVFWAARPDLGDMGDSEGQATGWPPQGDVRAYGLAFETIGFTAEQGTLTMEAIIVETFDRPAAVTPMVGWGTAGSIDFNSDNGGFTLANNPGTGWTLGTATTGVDDTELTMTGTGLVYTGVQPHYRQTSFDAQAKPVTNHLYRFSVTTACDSRTAVPCYRIVTNTQIKRPADTFGTMRDIAWIDWFAFSDTLGSTAGFKQPYYKPAAQTNCPFAPTTAGSVIDAYVYSHNVSDTSAGTTIFQPIIDVFDKGLYGGAGMVWPTATTPMTFSAASWEDLGADY